MKEGVQLFVALSNHTKTYGSMPKMAKISLCRKKLMDGSESIRWIKISSGRGCWASFSPTPVPKEFSIFPTTYHHQTSRKLDQCTWLCHPAPHQLSRPSTSRGSDRGLLPQGTAGTEA